MILRSNRQGGDGKRRRSEKAEIPSDIADQCETTITPSSIE